LYKDRIQSRDRSQEDGETLCWLRSGGERSLSAAQPKLEARPVVLGAILCRGIPTLDHLGSIGPLRKICLAIVTQPLTLDHDSTRRHRRLLVLGREYIRSHLTPQPFQAAMDSCSECSSSPARRRGDFPSPIAMFSSTSAMAGRLSTVQSPRVFQQIAGEVMLVHALHARR
jgi:hypothetical protein